MVTKSYVMRGGSKVQKMLNLWCGTVQESLQPKTSLTCYLSLLSPSAVDKDNKV